MAHISKLIDQKSIQTDIKIGILGPPRVGKTTLVRYLETGEVQEVSPRSTLGIEYREKGFHVDKIHIKIYDVGGQKLYQNIFWDMVVSESNIILYLIDSVVKPGKNTEFENHLEQFDDFCSILNDESKVLLLLNKQDLEDEAPINVEMFKKLFPIENLKINTLGIELISAKYGHRIENAINWLINQL